MNKLILFSIIIAAILSACNKTKYISEVTETELQEHIQNLCSQEFNGRLAGSETNLKAADYLADVFKTSKLESVNNYYLQNFDIKNGYSLSKNNYLIFDSIECKAGSDYMPFPYSASNLVEGNLLFCGFGIDSSYRKHWNDYNGNIENQWLIVLEGMPEALEKSRKMPDNYQKAKWAEKYNAKGLIIIKKENEAFTQLNRNFSAFSIPVIQLKYSKAKELFAEKKYNIDSLKKKAGNKPQNSINTQINIQAETELNPKIIKMQNVYAFIEGADSELKDEYIVLGAHYDHLGSGGKHLSSRRPDTVAIHPGADDNASGVAAILEVAHKLSENPGSLKRSVLFVLFDGEEQGLIGSKYFANNLPINVSQIKTMINLDMIGRLKSDLAMVIGGTGTSVQAESILDSLNTSYQFQLTYSKEGYGPSDHSAFYSKNIPVFFFTTGAHEDYHTPFDTWDKINYSGLKKISEFTATLTTTLANQEEYLTFQESGPKQDQSRHKMGMKVTLGIMPDTFGMEKRGMRADMVMPGRPAATAGMKNGDIITSINGSKIGDIYEYMNYMKQIEPGQRILVEIIRKDQNEILTIQL